MCGIGHYNIASLSASFRFGEGKQMELTITVYNREPHYDRVEFRYFVDDGLIHVERDHTFMAKDLKLNEEEKMQVSNIIVALNGLLY